MPSIEGFFVSAVMTIQKINLGSSPKGEGGDTWREGSEKINGNFQNLDERTTLAQETANSKTANATDAHLLSRSNHTGTQSISTILGLQVALDSAASQIDITGNAGTATKLQTPRTINGVSFDGTQNILLPSSGEYSLPTASASVLGGIKVGSGLDISNSILSVGTLNQSTTGNAATSTKLQTARTISLTGSVTGSVNFDGSSNASISTTIPGTTAITKGGTGATTVADARTNLSIYSKSEVDTKTAQATTDIRGTVTLATDAETLAGTAATKSVTPASFLTSLRKLVNVVGMTAHVVTAQRAFNTTYYNARDVPMRVHVGFRMPAGANANIEVDGTVQGFVTKLAAGGEEFYSLIGFVDPQKSYRFNIVGGIPFMQLCVEYYV